MRKPKEWLIVFVCVLISAALIYSALHPSEPDLVKVDQEWNIAVLLRSSTDDYWTYIRRGVDNAALEYDAKIQLHFPENDGDIEGQIRIAKSILDSNPDAIVIAANSDEEFAEVLDEANRRRIPVIAVDSKLKSGVTTTYIGADNEAYGQEAMTEIAKHLNYRGKLMIVNYENAGINGKAREAGVYEALDNYKNIELVDKVLCPVDLNTCKQLIISSIQENDVDGILALMTKSSISSALALKELNASSEIKMVGFDSSTELLELLQAGQMESLFVQNAFSLGYLAVQYAVQAANGQTLSQTYNMEMTIINKENMFWLKNQKLLYPVVK